MRFCFPVTGTALYFTGAPVLTYEPIGGYAIRFT